MHEKLESTSPEKKINVLNFISKWEKFEHFQIKTKKCK